MSYSVRFEKALICAATWHRDQKRKSTGAPYIGHLLAVAGTVIDFGGTEDEAIAALLHDAIEDQGGEKMRQQILELFGSEVAAIVEGCTDTDQMPKPPWKERKQAYIEHAKTAPPSVRIVSLADKLHNLRMILDDYRYDGDNVWTFFKGGKEGTLWYYFKLIQSFKIANSKDAVHPFALTRLTDELWRVYVELSYQVNLNEGLFNGSKEKHQENLELELSIEPARDQD